MGNLTATGLKRLLSYNKDTGKFTWICDRKRVRAGSEAGCVNSCGYVVIRVDYRMYYAHRLAWLYETGAWPQQKLDHRNRDRRDNRFRNLRLATQSQNKVNGKLHKNNTSGANGVTTRYGKWYARVMKDGQRPAYVFTSKRAAVAFAKKLTNNLHGEFAP